MIDNSQNRRPGRKHAGASGQFAASMAIRIFACMRQRHSQPLLHEGMPMAVLSDQSG